MDTRIDSYYDVAPPLNTNSSISFGRGKIGNVELRCVGVGRAFNYRRFVEKSPVAPSPPAIIRKM
uniref:Uncharacterized protein MANES_18G023000 n=1 Tax=Rhizophora mucronata TaxID=61149 RepID=A0A2P2JLI3_RHIMU